MTRANAAAGVPATHQFYPLDPALKADGSLPGSTNGGASSKVMRLEAVVFDVDGTLCLPQNYMFATMRSALGIPKSVDILNHVYSLNEPEQSEAMDKIKAIEREAMSKQTPQPGLEALMAHLDSRGIPKAICTRNFNGPVEHLLAKFLPRSKFFPIVTRDFRPPKPDPAGIIFIAKELGIEREEFKKGETPENVLPIIMVGDSKDDMLAGRRAGAATVLLGNEENAELAEHECTDLVIGSLTELISILDSGFVTTGTRS